METLRLGIDVGGVIISRGHHESRDTTFFTGNYLETPPVVGAFDAIRRLIEEKFGQDNVFLVSKAYPKTQRKTLEWFDAQGFYQKTGINPQNVLFVLERAEKEAVCKKLGIDYFIDDRAEVLYHLSPTVPNLFLFAPVPIELARLQSYGLKGKAKVVNKWQEATKLLLT